MNMKQIRLLTLLMTVMMLFPACTGGAEVQPGGAVYTSLDQIGEKRIGVITGSVQAIQAEARFPNAAFSYFNSSVDCLNALRAHKIDAYADAEALVKYMMSENQI